MISISGATSCRVALYSGGLKSASRLREYHFIDPSGSAGRFHATKGPLFSQSLYSLFCLGLLASDGQTGRQTETAAQRERGKEERGSWQKKKLEQRNSSLSLWSLFVPLTHSLYELTPRGRERETDSHIHSNFGVWNIISMWCNLMS